MALTDNGKFAPSDRLTSPGVFTREINQSGVAQGVAQIGGVVVAPFSKGPGFSPTIIRSQPDLESVFGTPDGVLYGPYAAQQYLKEHGQVTICRVGGLAGYEQKDALFITAIPGEYSRDNITSSLGGKVLGATIATDGSGSFSLQGAINATFTSEIYADSTQLVGNISGSITGSNYTGSVLREATFELPLIDSTLPHKPADTLILAATMSVVQVNSCRSECTLTGATIRGAYGNFNVSTWTPGDVSVEDDCGGVTESLGRDEVVLAVLANTAYDRGQEWNGFSGSVLSLQDSASLSSEFKLGLVTTYYDDSLGDIVSSQYGTYNFSLDGESSAYLTNVFGKVPTAGYIPVADGQKIEAAYTYRVFDNKIKEIISEMLTSGSWKITCTTRDAMKFDDGITPDVGTSTFDLRQAETPWIRSQQVAPFSGAVSSSVPTTFDLFKVHTLADGTYTNTAFKIEISNVKSPGSIPNSKFGSFSLTVRDFNDTDVKSVILEKFDNLNLDPTSANYIARRIGDMYNYIDFNGKILEFGDYQNKSSRIRIEMATSPWPITAIPFGFAPYASPIGGDYARLGKLPPMQFTSASAYIKQPGRYASGVCFQPAPSSADAELSALYPNGSSIGPELDNKQYFAPVPLGASTVGNAGFDLEEVCGVTPYYVAASENVNVKMRRFVLGFQSGFDGQAPATPVLVGNDALPTNQQGLDCSTNISRGSYAYKQCLTTLSNTDEWDFNLIIVPGINYEQHPYVARLAIDLCEARTDAFCIVDLAANQLAGSSAITNVLSLANEIDSSYAAAYYPWVKIKDTNTNRIVTVPPSVVMMGVYAANDNIQAEWYAPAGMNRGGIEQAVQVMDRLIQSERDDLIEGSVNPIAAFPGGNIVAWGQQTLDKGDTALSKINVRRLLITVKKFISASTKFLVFEQNTAVTRNRFLNIVNPYLESIQQRSGLYAFQVVMDETTNTPDLIDRGILYGKIKLQPTKSAEIILLDFEVSNTGAVFTA